MNKKECPMGVGGFFFKYHSERVKPVLGCPAGLGISMKCLIVMF